MNRRPAHLALCLLAAAAALVGACASRPLAGDRLFLAGDLVRAEAAYRDYLGRDHGRGDAQARARYRLGLIYALPDSELHDGDLADRTLEELIAREPGSTWARQAALLLSLRRESDRVAAELAAQTERAEFLLAEVERLEAEAAQAGAAVEDRDQRVERLAQEIGRLKKSIDDLGQVLAAREKELEQIKRIDLQTPP